jgi:aspartate/methionine/tyrosine aminotransferase
MLAITEAHLGRGFIECVHAGLGILVAPGAFYGDAEHVRVALTASDQSIAEAAARLSGA